MVFGQLDIDESAIWSLLLASGYLKPDAIEYRGDIEAVNYYMNKVVSEIFSFFDVFFGEKKQVKVSRKDFITVSFWDLWLSSQKAMKSVPTGKAGLEDMMQSLLQGAFQRKE